MDEPRKDDPDKSGQSPEESLSDVPPTPETTPRIPSVIGPGLNAAILTAAGAGALFLIAGTMTPTMGATRSAKLKWAERQRQIDQAERDAKPNNSERP